MTPDERVHALLAECDGDDVCLAELLCDRHRPDDVAFTVVQPDLTSVDLTYGDLRERSERFAAALVALGVRAR